MFQYTRTKHGIPYREVWFLRDRAELSGRGLVRLMQSKERLGLRSAPFHTLLVDLKQEEAAIWEKMSKNGRTKIKKCESDDGTATLYHTNPSTETLEEAECFHAACAEGTPIPPFNAARVKALSGHLSITQVKDAAGEILVQHVYVHDATRARLLYSVSPRHEAAEIKNLIGRANRLLHWQGIRHFRERGFATYDLGGISSLGENGATPGIDRFKREFSDVSVTEYNGILLVL